MNVSENIVELSAREANLKRLLSAHIEKIGFVKDAHGGLILPAYDKQSYRDAHADQRIKNLEANGAWISRKRDSLITHFALGSEINVQKIRPSLIPVRAQTWQGDLFRFATYYWRIPISEGYGRRMRFLVWDEHHQKLIGIFALGDAVFNLKARDNFIGWDHLRREEALVNLMDAYVLGAVPPYNMLLGGKLVASLIRTREIVTAFEEKYHDTVGLISKKSKHAKLVAVTTTSALGRSSLYNRLRLDNTQIFSSIGSTTGWGHFHFSDELFGELREYLHFVGDPYADAHGYGQGPNFRFRLIRRALKLLGLDRDTTKHGLTREVFFCPLATNSLEYLRGEQRRVKYHRLPTVRNTSLAALSRWIIPRSIRNPEFREWKPTEFLRELDGVCTLRSKELPKKAT